MTTREHPVAPSPAATTVRRLLRAARKAALATLRPPEGRPFASLVAVATALDASPLMLLSDLAVHTRNLRADPRASLLIDGTGSASEPLSGPRASLEGTIEDVVDDLDRQRYLARHPDARQFAGFSDFRFYALRLERAHLVEGFGRIVEVPANQIVLAREILEPQWQNCAAALQAVADLMKSDEGRVIDLDPDGFEFENAAGRAWRPYPWPVERASDAPAAIVSALGVKGGS